MNVQIESENLTVLVNHRGAELCSVKNKSLLEYIWTANKDVWPRHSPVLFPIVGKLRNDAYSYLSKEYRMTQHGFARDLDFDLVQHAANSCTFELRSNPDTKRNYPFEFLFQIAYLLEENTLSTEFRVVNLSPQNMLFSVGAHPGFNCPLLPGESFEDYFFDLEKSSYEIRELDNGLRLPNKKTLSAPHTKLFLSSSLFDKDALVFEGHQLNSVTLRSLTSHHSIRLDCAGWPYFGLWSKKACRQFVCMEPWYGIADQTSSEGNLAKKEGIIVLPAGEEHLCSYSLTFH
ncbi:MAG: aldose 1-epimerase family protein [bacterium]|nr:aldose 1-epimerase family protein [bacterium]